IGVCAHGTADTITELLQALELPTAMPDYIDADAMIVAMRSDKKNREGKIRAALLKEFGAIARDGDGWTMELELNVIRELM
ncbi:MAG: hypothetical protein ABI743_13570, partial [bacterium]